MPVDPMYTGARDAWRRIRKWADSVQRFKEHFAAELDALEDYFGSAERPKDATPEPVGLVGEEDFQEFPEPTPPQEKSHGAQTRPPKRPGS